MSKRIVVLISGSGSNLQAIMDACQAGAVKGQVVAVLSNIAGVFGLERAEKAGIATDVVSHKDFDSREAFDAAMAAKIDTYAPDLVVLAGFMRILTADFVRHFEGKMLNIHPSLLPKYKGLNTHQRALEAGDSEHGCSVHFVTEELDAGPPVIQGRVSIDVDDSAESLQKKVHVQEHVIYPKAVAWFCEGKLSFSQGVARFEGTPVPEGGVAH